MYIKRYSVAAFVLMGLVGWYVYAYLTHETMIVDFFGIPMPSLSIAVLVVIPLFVLYLASVLHMSFYGMLAKLKNRKAEKDYEKILDSITDAYLGKENRTHKFKTETFTLFGELLDNSTVFPTANLNLKANDEQTKKVKAVLNDIESIKKGEVVELKNYALNANNPLVVQNNRNMYKNGDLSNEDILSHASKYNVELAQEAYADYVKTNSVANIDKYQEFLTKEALYSVLARVNAEENTLEISTEAIMTLIANLDFDKDSYMKIARIVDKNMIPDQRIKLFETLSNGNEEATDAYLFTLLDLEMLSPAYALLEISQPDEYLNFKAYKALKESNQQFSIELFI